MLKDWLIGGQTETILQVQFLEEAVYISEREMPSIRAYKSALQSIVLAVELVAVPILNTHCKTRDDVICIIITPVGYNAHEQIWK